jgi:hypothetical protein
VYFGPTEWAWGTIAVLYAILVGLLVGNSIHHGMVKSSLFYGLLVSAIPVTVAHIWEGMPLMPLLAKDPWLIGGAILPPIAFAVLAYGWAHYQLQPWVKSPWWAAASAAIGAAAGIWFRYGHDYAAYKAADALPQWHSVSKYFSDCGSAALIGLAVYALVPLMVCVHKHFPWILNDGTKLGWVALVLLVVGIAMSAIHGSNLGPADFHPATYYG